MENLNITTMKQKLCTYTKRDSSRCTSFAMKGSDFCYRHNPDISDDDKLIASSKGGKKAAKPEFIETPLPEIKIEKMQDVVTLLADTINNMRSGKISQKSGTSIGYLAFIMMMAMDKAKEEKEQEEIAQLKSEGKWRPEPEYVPKFYRYKDEFYLDKDGNPLVVEDDGSLFRTNREFKPECTDNIKQKHRKRRSIPIAPDKAREKNIPIESITKAEEAINNDTDIPDIPVDENQDPEKFYREATANIIKAVKQSGILNNEIKT